MGSSRNFQCRSIIMDVVLCYMHFIFFKISMLSSRRSLTYFTSRQASKDVNVKVPEYSNLNDNTRKYMSSYSVESNSYVLFFFWGFFGVWGCIINFLSFVILTVLVKREVLKCSALLDPGSRDQHTYRSVRNLSTKNVFINFST